MSATKSFVAGHPPGLAIGQGNSEAEKYGRMWEHPAYRAVSPGEALVPLFLQIARPTAGSEVLDFGCGTGRAALRMSILASVSVTMLDFVGNSLDPEIRTAMAAPDPRLKFLKHDLLEPIPCVARYGVAFDVMEHIPAAKVERVLENMLRAAQHVFLSISTTDDRCGELIDETLHVTVQPYSWWLEQFVRLEAVVNWSQETDDAVYFYVSAWRSGREVVKSGVLNETEQAIRANVAHNLAQGWEQVHPAGTNDIEVAILGGGPSLAQFEEQIRAQQAAGVKLVALNGAGHWARERGLGPVNQMIVDARPFNARFTHPPDPAGLYFIASQCHPSVLEGLPKDRTYLYHTLSALVGDLVDAQYGQGGWHAIPGGSTVLLRAIPLFRLLGYRRFHLYGCDSCLTDDAHHAYAQPENDGGLVLPVTTTPGGRVFRCYPWMIAQAQEFIDLIRAIGDVVELEVYGDGLLAYLLHTAATHDNAGVAIMQPSAD